MSEKFETFKPFNHRFELLCQVLQEPDRYYECHRRLRFLAPLLNLQMQMHAEVVWLRQVIRAAPDLDNRLLQQHVLVEVALPKADSQLPVRGHGPCGVAGPKLVTVQVTHVNHCRDFYAAIPPPQRVVLVGGALALVYLADRHVTMMPLSAAILAEVLKV